MAMNKTEMANAIYAKLEAAYWPGTALPADAKAEIIKYYEAVSDGQIEHMTAKMDVLAGITVQVSVDPTSHQGGGSTNSLGKVK